MSFCRAGGAVVVGSLLDWCERCVVIEKRLYGSFTAFWLFKCDA